MNKRNWLWSLSAATALILSVFSAHAQQRTEIQMWMGLTGLGGELLTKYANDFNASQNEYRVVMSFKGQYPEQRAAAVAAYRAGKAPHIMQMFDAGSGDMMAAKEAIVPVSEVFKRANLQFNPADFIGPARGYYSLPSGEMLSMPFNVSTAVMFYNKDAFRKAGLDADKPPQTWPDLIKASKTIREKNAAACGFTTTWLAWIMLEQHSARHNIPMSDKDNGKAGGGASLNLNTPANQRMVQTLMDMQKDKSFDYGGRSNDAAAKFISGECAVLLQSSGGHGAIARDAKFQFGVAQLPYWPDLTKGGKAFASTIGGASLWVFNAPNRTANEYKGVALFLNHLRSTPVMTDWAKQTGFLPATNAAYKAMTDEGFFAKNPGRDAPIVQLIGGQQGQHTGGYRFGRWVEARDVYHEEVEKALQGRQSAADALHNTQRRGTALLRAFDANSQR